MANTTNFGWETPDDTDLVKDGASAMRTLGNSIDASFVDLKGGTTGQVLAKASNTDLDFTWSAADPLSILDAKGDLISATAADTPARLAVGTNGQVLTVDSAESTGLKWATPAAGSNFSLLATQSVTTGSSYQITGLSGYNTLHIMLTGLSSTAGSVNYTATLNNDTASNYIIAMSGYVDANLGNFGGSNANISLGKQGDNAGNGFSGTFTVLGANTSGKKVGIVVAGGNSNNSTAGSRWGGYSYDSASVISTVEIKTSGTFDNGTIYVYGSVN